MVNSVNPEHTAHLTSKSNHFYQVTSIVYTIWSAHDNVSPIAFSCNEAPNVLFKCAAHMSLRCQYTRRMDVNEDSDRNFTSRRTEYASIVVLKRICSYAIRFKVSKGTKIRNRYNQAPHQTQDINGKVTHSQLDTTNESLEASPFPAGDHKAHKTDAHEGIANTRQKIIKYLQKKYRLGTVSRIFYWRA